MPQQNNPSYPPQPNDRTPILDSRSFPEISHLVIASGYRLRSTLICAIALSLLSAAIAFYFVPAQYLASATVRVLQREGYLLTTQQSRSDDVSFVRAQQALVSQDQTLSNALNDKALNDLVRQIKTEDPISWLKAQIKADMSVGSETMTITASNPSAEMAVQASRAVTQAYHAAITEQLRASRDRRIKELENTASEVDSKLMQQWRLLQSKSGTIGSGNPQSISVSEQIKLQNFRENTQRLRSLQFQRSQLELQLIAEKDSKPKAPEFSELQIQTSVSQHPEVVSLRDQIRKVDLKIQEMKLLVQSESAPQMVRLQNERRHYVDSLNQTESKVATNERKRLSSEVATNRPTSRLKELESQIELIDLEIKELQATTSQLETSIVEASGPSGVELEIIRHEIEREERLADSLWKTIQELRIEARAEPRVAMGSLPTATTRLSRAKQSKAVFGAAALGLVLGILGVGFIEWSSRRIRYADEVVQKVRLKVIDTASHKGDYSGAKAMVAQLLLLAKPDGSLPSVYVTSASAMEPRSRFSIELAEAVVASGRRVLLLILDQDNRGGTTKKNNDTALNGEANEWFSQIRSSVAHGFDYLSFGACQVALHLVASKSMAEFLTHANHYYDSLIVLGPAVLSNPESVLMASRLDLTVLVTEIGQSRLDQLIAARNRLQLPNANVFGTVLTHRRGHTSKVRHLRTSESDPFATVQSFVDVEAEVLASVKELQGQIKQFDGATAPIAAPHLSSTSRPKLPSSNSRTSE